MLFTVIVHILLLHVLKSHTTLQLLLKNYLVYFYLSVTTGVIVSFINLLLSGCGYDVNHFCISSHVSRYILTTSYLKCLGLEVF
jgi:hypothetical protein